MFGAFTDAELLKYGVPTERLDDVRKASDATILELADLLPNEAAEALLCLATGALPQIIPPAALGSDPFMHPDAERRFRTMHNVEELERAFEIFPGCFIKRTLIDWEFVTWRVTNLKKATRRVANLLGAFPRNFHGLITGP